DPNRLGPLRRVPVRQELRLRRLDPARTGPDQGGRTISARTLSKERVEMRVMTTGHGDQQSPTGTEKPVQVLHGTLSAGWVPRLLVPLDVFKSGNRDDPVECAFDVEQVKVLDPVGL